jgi:uncharacterized protein
MLALGLVLAAVIGLALGLLGGGGSILTVPVLVYVLGYAAKPAIAMSLPIVGVTSLLGAALHWRLGTVRWKTAGAFGAIAMVGAFAGARLAGFLSGGVQLALLAIVMLAAGRAMLRRAAVPPVSSETTRSRAIPLGLAALGVGIVTGVVGIGGGFLVVPALVVLARVPIREAAGTSLVVIAMNSAAGFVGYLGTADLDWAMLAGFTAIAVAGAVGGVALARVVPPAALRRTFGLFLIVVGGSVLYQNRGVLHGAAANSSVARPRGDAASRRPR